jgi:membrane protein DedA with SNARE-associated domain
MDSTWMHFFDHPSVTAYALMFVIAFGEAFIFTGFVIPGTVLLMMAGGLSAQGSFNVFDILMLSSIGAIIGDGVSYEMGRRGKHWIERSAFLKRQLERAEPFFLRHQTKSIFMGRFIGWVRPLVPFIAGTMQMKRKKYYLASVLSAIAWAVVFVGLGFAFGSAWKLALVWVTRIGGAAAIAFVLFLAYRMG